MSADVPHNGSTESAVLLENRVGKMAETARASRAGLFVDLDGTLADSIHFMEAVYGRFLASFGKKGSDSEFARLNGPPLRAVVVDLKRTHNIPGDIDELLTYYRQIVRDEYMHVAPAAGARELLGEACENGMAVAIVTSNLSKLANEWLSKCELAHRVELVIGSEHTLIGKPAPEPYLLALERTQCLAAESFAIEDTVTGAQAAQSAGLRTMLIGKEQANAGSSLPVADLREAARCIFDRIAS